MARTRPLLLQLKKVFVHPTRTKQVRRSPEEWQALIKQFNQSQLSRQAFCKQQSLALSTFDLWRRRLKIVDAQPPRPSEAMFVELSSSDDARSSARSGQPLPAPTGWDIELQIGDGVVLRLRQAC